MRDQSSDAYKMPQFELMNQAYKQYRASGFTLMTTVITLSAGGIGGLGGVGVPLGLRATLFIPFALALLQQLCHYHGELWHARGAEEAFQYGFKKAEFRSQPQSKPDGDAVNAALFESINKTLHLAAKSNLWFSRADTLCDWSVGLFLACAIVIIARVLI